MSATHSRSRPWASNTLPTQYGAGRNEPSRRARRQLAANPLALNPKLGMVPRCTIAPTSTHGSPRSARPAPHPADSWPPQALIVPTRGDTKQTVHRGHRITDPVHPHELEDFGGIESVSRATQAAAFARVSHSSLSCWFSRRSCLRFLDSETDRDAGRRHDRSAPPGYG